MYISEISFHNFTSYGYIIGFTKTCAITYMYIPNMGFSFNVVNILKVDSEKTERFF